MKKFILRHRKGWLMGIAIFQLVGGLAMLILLISILASQEEIAGGLLIATIAIVALSLVSVITGILYLFKRNEARFLLLSKLNFYAQLLQFSIPLTFSYGFYYGPYLALGLGSDHALTIKFEMLTANFGFSFGDEQGMFILFNFIPLFILITLRWIKRNKIVSPEFENTFIEEPQQEA